ncbi:MAG: hypothetical protein WAX04_11120, partial [Oscillospiraceae bacterium]
FYKFVNKKLSNKSGIGPLQDDGGSIICDDESKANLLNNYFYSVFIQDNGSLPEFRSRFSDDPPGSISPRTISDVEINEEIIGKILKKLKTNAASGPDSLPPILFNKASASLVYPLSVVFRTFIDLHDLPNEWKKSIITPKFKKGSPSSPSNYRPISLLALLAKYLKLL